jgi:hypothetical protein
MTSNPLSLTDEHYKAIGKISVEMADIEFCIRNTLSTLMSDNYNFNFMITVDMYFLKLLDLLKRTVKYKINDQVLLDKFRIFVINIEKYEIERNRFIHSIWFYNTDIKQLIRTRYSKSNKEFIGIDTEIVDTTTPHKLNELADNIKVESDNLFRLSIEMRTYLINNPKEP